MRYLFSTGIIGAVTTGLTLLRGSREQRITWRAVLGWVSWAIMAALSVGAVIDTYRDRHGLPVATDSPLMTKKRSSKKAKKS